MLVTIRTLLYMMVMVAGMCLHNVVSAAGIESLVMPGKLVQGHAKYESECGKCHQPFSKQNQNRLCLDCHDKVDTDVRDQLGFHGRSGAGKQQCSSCHEDHLGRDARIVQFSRGTFDHDMTDYSLQGAHAVVDCSGCHAVGKKYRDAVQACSGCHKGHDVHKGNLGERCADCHDAQAWKKHDFNHDDTDFRLRGKHVKVACDDCHPAQRYEGTPVACNDCHRFNDVHAGRYGNQCGDCHVDNGWKNVRFDHDRNTDYPLTGRHRKVACASCHAGEAFDEPLPGDCYSCHRDVDQHKGSYGRKCDSCHATDGWGKTRFDHAAKTDFPLQGRHEKITCTACHRGEAASEKLGTECIACHRVNDVHAGKQGEQCGRCHGEDGWAEKVRFEHDMTRFPLIGLHAVVPCEECHLSAVFTDAGKECIDCHEEDDAHHERLGRKCASCHNPNAWSLWVFDHREKTGFALDGGHDGIECESCHAEPARRGFRISSSCDSCHRTDDVHDGGFGRYCDRCHNTRSFDEVEIR